jgi:hypothetical protein
MHVSFLQRVEKARQIILGTNDQVYDNQGFATVTVMYSLRVHSIIVNVHSSAR